MPVTRDQARDLAALVAAARPGNAAAWDRPGIVAAIGHVKHRDLADVALAAFRLARDPSANTPAMLADLRHECWAERNTSWRPHEPFDRGTFCANCQQPEHRCRQLWAADHDFVSVHEHTRRATKDRAERPPLRALLPTPDDPRTDTPEEH